MGELNIVGIRIDDRDDRAPQVQKVLTSYGTKIIGRFGIPRPNKEDGLIAVIVEADSDDVRQMTADLKRISGVTVNAMNLK